MYYEKNCFSKKKSLVESGQSETFKSWQKVCPSLTEEEFIAGLEWLCDDPCDGGKTGDKMTRELALSPDGVIKLKRVYDALGMCTFVKGEHTWFGEHFRLPATEEFFRPGGIPLSDLADKDGKIPQTLKLCISCRDRIGGGSPIKIRLRDLRKSTGLSQKDFAEKYAIPCRTYEKWEQGTAVPPGYLFALLERAVKEDFTK